jgi:transmembrane sensor
MKGELVVAGEKITSINNHIVKSKSNGIDSRLWYTRRMYFKDESLKNILSVLNQNFNTTFVTANEDIGKRRITVTFSNETVESMTEVICQTLNLKSQTNDDSIVLSDNKTGARGN